MRDVEGQGAGTEVVLQIIWRRFLNAMWRSLPECRTGKRIGDSLRRRSIMLSDLAPSAQNCRTFRG